MQRSQGVVNSHCDDSCREFEHLASQSLLVSNVASCGIMWPWPRFFPNRDTVMHFLSPFLIFHFPSQALPENIAAGFHVVFVSFCSSIVCLSCFYPGARETGDDGPGAGLLVLSTCKMHQKIRKRESKVCDVCVAPSGSCAQQRR